MDIQTLTGELADLAERAKENDDQALQAMIYMVCALACCPFGSRDKMLVSLAAAGGRLLEQAIETNFTRFVPGSSPGARTARDDSGNRHRALDRGGASETCLTGL